MGRNSTRHPMGLCGGGGLNLIVCQLVDCRFCKETKKNSVIKIKNQKREKMENFSRIFHSNLINQSINRMDSFRFFLKEQSVRMEMEIRRISTVSVCFSHLEMVRAMLIVLENLLGIQYQGVANKQMRHMSSQLTVNSCHREMFRIMGGQKCVQKHTRTTPIAA